MLVQSNVENPATQRASGRFYRPELDILRFTAFLMVYECHALPVQAGSSHIRLALRQAGTLGVPLFFLLSAFLITELLLKEKARTGTIKIRAFYIRRVLRIWPLYFAVLFAGFLVSYLLREPMAISALASYMLLAGNLWTARYGYLTFGLISLWSISIEEQYYLVWPSLVRLCSVRTVEIVCIAVWLISQATLLLLCARHAALNPTIWTNSLVQFQYFALGSMLSLALNGKVPSIPVWGRVAAAAAGLILVFVANYTFLMQTTAPSSIRQTYFGYLITGPAILFLFFSAFGATPSRRMAPAIWMGKISYGLYVFHEPVLGLMLALSRRVLRPGGHPTVLTIGMGFPLTVLVAFLSYRYFESPFLRFKERFAVVKSRLA